MPDSDAELPNAEPDPLSDEPPESDRNLDGWLRIDLRRYDSYRVVDPWPFVCCNCLTKENHLRWKHPLDTKWPIKIPICKECLERWLAIDARRSRIMGIAGFVGLGIAFIALPISDHWLRFLGSLFLGFCLMLGASRAFESEPGRRPPVKIYAGGKYSTNRVSLERYVWIKFRNREFVALISQDPQITGDQP